MRAKPTGSCRWMSAVSAQRTPQADCPAPDSAVPASSLPIPAQHGYDWLYWLMGPGVDYVIELFLCQSLNLCQILGHAPQLPVRIVLNDAAVVAHDRPHIQLGQLSDRLAGGGHVLRSAHIWPVQLSFVG